MRLEFHLTKTSKSIYQYDWHSIKVMFVPKIKRFWDICIKDGAMPFIFLKFKGKHLSFIYHLFFEIY